ncbi:MAG: hypothetical protein P8J61_09900 [Gammaproteobacteria bacterium]|jgi:hypothetical protein|nr:hypothetical protein [Gammaproteobacteria bacterium]
MMNKFRFSFLFEINRYLLPVTILSTLVFMFSIPASAQVDNQDDPSWMWPEARWRGAVERVRAGQELVPQSWPQSGKVAVALSFDFDTETLSLRSSVTTPSVLPSVQKVLTTYKLGYKFIIL